VSDHRRARLTIGVPVYNGERFLAQSLDALLAQDFGDFRLIISDNASTDSTPEIAEEYARLDPRVEVVHQPTNVGGAANFSLLVGLADTPYFKWASADDICTPTFVSRCVRELEQHPDAVLAYTRTLIIDEAGQELLEYDDRLATLEPDPAARLLDYVRMRGLSNAAQGVIRTDALRRTSLIQPKVSSDLTLLAELLLEGGFVLVADRLFQRRKVATSAGLGQLSKRALQDWFEPGSGLPSVPPMIRVYFDIERSILRSRLRPTDRIRTAVAFGAAWPERRLRIRAGVARKALRERRSHTAPRSRLAPR
jgi:glycosyltransferase involved in cell wall biosynthesis